jgi:O-antigen/teichoic acid export membrane protein
MGMSLRQDAIRSALWLMLRFAGRQGANTVAFFVLATLVPPDEFGLGSIAVAVGMLLKILVQRGLRDRVIQVPNLTEDELNTAFWLNAILGVVLALSLILISIPLSNLFNQPTLASMLWVVASIPVVGAISSIQEARLERSFDHQHLTTAQGIASILAALVAVALAASGLGAWAVVSLAVVETIGIAIATLAVAWWVPGCKLERGLVPAQLAFAWPIMVIGLATVGNVRGAQLIVGMILGPAAAGIFRIGLQVNQLLMQIVCAPVGQVLLPAYARLREGFGERFLLAQTAFATVTLPVFFISAALAPTGVEWMLGAEWSSAGNLAGILCLSILASVTVQPLTPLLLVRGASQTALGLIVATALAGIIFVWIGAWSSVEFAALGFTARAVVSIPLSFVIVTRHLGIQLSQLVAALLPPAIFACLSGLTAYAVISLPFPSPTLIRIALAGLTSSILFIMLCRSVFPMIWPLVYGRLTHLAPGWLEKWL